MPSKIPQRIPDQIAGLPPAEGDQDAAPDSIDPNALVNESEEPSQEPVVKIADIETMQDAMAAIARLTKQLSKMSISYADMEKRVAGHTKHSRQMRIFVEMVNGLGDSLLPRTADNPKGVTDAKSVETLFAHVAGMAQVAEKAAKDKGF